MVAENGEFDLHAHPKPFASGDWHTRSTFVVMPTAGRAVKLPTLLEGEALATWLDLSDDERKNYVWYCERKTHRRDGII